MVTISQKDVVATVSVAGIVVRYGFYLVGAITLALIAIAITTIWGWRARTIDAKPAFRIAAPELGAAVRCARRSFSAGTAASRRVITARSTTATWTSPSR